MLGKVLQGSEDVSKDVQGWKGVWRGLGNLEQSGGGRLVWHVPEPKQGLWNCGVRTDVWVPGADKRSQNDNSPGSGRGSGRGRSLLAWHVPASGTIQVWERL